MYRAQKYERYGFVNLALMKKDHEFKNMYSNIWVSHLYDNSIETKTRLIRDGREVDIKGIRL